LIAMFHIIGVEKEKNGEIIETETVKVLWILSIIN
jgi:hypothetical protein